MFFDLPEKPADILAGGALLIEVEGCESRARGASRRNERLIVWAAFAAALVFALTWAGVIR